MVMHLRHDAMMGELAAAEDWLAVWYTWSAWAVLLDIVSSRDLSEWCA
jgi:hypothetical protein